MRHPDQPARPLPRLLLARLLPAAMLFAVLLLSAVAACSQPATQEKVSSGARPGYGEPHRPQFHFSPPAMWMNDPNGMVFFDGEYHLFYQYYPDATVWGPMHWGHAVSTDLVHWQHLPIALYPDDLGYIFSGSAVVDWRNSSGFGVDGQPPLVAIFTYHDPERAKAGGKDHEYQGIAWSTDRGRSWTKYAGNPVLPNTQKLQDFRDPKVFWHEDWQRWVMALSATDHVQFWASPNLKDWSYLSDFGREWGAHGGVWECPDLVEMPVEGTEETRWVLILNLNPGGPQGGSGTQYFVGDFDGRRFTLDESFERALQTEGAVWLDAGRDNYAGVTWADVPAEDGRTLFIGWMGNWDYAQQVPTHPWRSAMTLPRELALTRTTHAGYRVHSRPVAELQALRGEAMTIAPLTIEAGTHVPLALDVPVSPSEWILEFELPDAVGYAFGIEFGNDLGERYRFGYDGALNQFYSDRTASGDFSFSEKFPGVHRARRLAPDRKLTLHLFIDTASIEAFADGGANVLTDTFFPTRPFSAAALYSQGEGVMLVGGKAFALESIWHPVAAGRRPMRPLPSSKGWMVSNYGDLLFYRTALSQANQFLHNQKRPGEDLARLIRETYGLQ
jgi:fructan beta-fructosidase